MLGVFLWCIKTRRKTTF